MSVRNLHNVSVLSCYAPELKRFACLVVQTISSVLEVEDTDATCLVELIPHDANSVLFNLHMTFYVMNKYLDEFGSGYHHGSGHASKTISRLQRFL